MAFAVMALLGVPLLVSAACECRGDEDLADAWLAVFAAVLVAAALAWACSEPWERDVSRVHEFQTIEEEE